MSDTPIPICGKPCSDRGSGSPGWRRRLGDVEQVPDEHDEEEGHQIRQDVRRQLAFLDPRDAELLRLAYCDGKNTTEIAKLLSAEGLPATPRSTRRRLRAARYRLRALLEQHGYTCAVIFGALATV
ncbi:MAG: hypothetical protein CMJ83_09775 [Planctomycetes bacterium]|nr:hypothetical protein [Planctomycetota bacterium]